MIFWDNVKSLFNTGSQCIFCGAELPLDRHICETCSESERKLYKAEKSKDGVAYVYRYEGIIKNLLHKLKYNDDISGAYYAAEVMAKELSNFAEDFENCVITNVPVHKARRRSRGFDQCEIIAKRISEISGIPYVALFERIKNTRAQYKLNAAQRAKNMSGAFKYIGDDIDLTGKTVILTDDICTTGSTLKECIKTLPDNAVAVPFVFAKE